MAKKAQKTGFSIQGFDASHYKQTEAYTQAIDDIFSKAIADFSRMASGLTINPDKPFSFDDYPTAKNAAQKIVGDLAGKMQGVITKGSREQWLYANKKADEFLNHILNTSKVPKKALAKFQDRNLDALDAFQKRKTDGLDLSKRVWNYADQFKKQMELGIDIGVGDGRSAQELSRDLRQYLVDPDKLFRRVRDKHGNLVLSKAAKAFHPGQGKYRSSYKNAMRLTRSEINTAYRTADQLRWENLDFVVGYEVKLSGRHPVEDICDHLKGRYPKTFVFKGWHPQCLCYVVPILMDMDEFNTDELNELKAALKGTEYKQFSSRNTVSDVPQGFKDWVDSNTDRSRGWRSQPYFIRDNFKGGTLQGGLKFDTFTATIKPPIPVPKPVVKPAPVAKPSQEKVPEEFKPESSYMAGEKFTFKDEFFELLDPNRPVKIRFSSRDDSYHQGGLVQIGNGQRAAGSPYFKERVVYHEYGHAIDYQRNLRYSPEVKNLMDRHKLALKKRETYTRNVKQYDYSTGKYKYVKMSNETPKIGIISDRLNNLYDKVRRMSDKTFTGRGMTKKDVLEAICSTQDTIMSLNPNYGFGHTKSYFKNPGMKEAEFLAHAFENAFAGNPIFKKYLPDLYEEMVTYIKSLK